MATTQDAISRLQIQATTQGVDEATDSLNKLAAAQGGVAVASASVEKSTQSLDGKFASIEKRYVDGVAAQQSYAKVQQTVNAAVAQNPALTDRANVVLAAAKQRYDDLTHTQTAFEQGLESAKDKAADLTRELGPMGTALTAIGPAGLAIGAAIGLAVLALDKLKDQADEAGRWAKQLQDAANVIGINTEQLQALNEAAARAGVTAADNVAGFEKFAVSLGQLKDGSGQLYTQLQKINPSLAAQLSTAKDAATGWNLLAQAYANADKTQQTLLARAAFGRGGAAQGQVLLQTAQAGGIGGLEAANEDTISKDQIKRWADLTTQINQATEAAQHNFQSIFTDAILTSEKNFADNMLSISRYAKEFALSEDWKKFTDFVSSPTSLAFFGAMAKALIPTPLVVAGGAIGSLFSKQPQSMANFQSPANSYSTFQGDGSGPAANDNGPGSPSYEAARLRDLVSALGGAATARDHYNATIAASKAALDIASKSADTDALTVAKGVAGRVQANAGLELATALQNAHNTALGQSATIDDIVAAKQNQLAKLQQQGAGLSPAQIQQQLDLTKAQALGTFQINAQTDAEKIKIATLTMSTQSAIAYQLVQTKINEAIALGKPLTADQIADLQKSADAFAQTKVKADTYTQAMQDAKNAGSTFTNDLISGLLSGKSIMESLTAAAQNLGKQLTSSGIKNIFDNPTSPVGYIETGVGILTQLISGGDNQALKDAQLNWKNMAVDVVNFNLAAKGFDLGPLTQELQSLLSTYTQLQAAAAKANDQQGSAQASIAFGQAVNRIVAEFKSGSEVLTPYAQAVKDLTGEAQGLEDTLTSLNDGSLANQVAIALGARLTALAKQFADALTQSLQARINTATGHDDYNQATALLTQHQQDILQAQQLGISQALVQQTFAAEAQRIVDDAGLVGDSFSAFITQFPQFAGVVHESSSALQAANDQFTALTKTINDYLNSLALGANSTLSPQQQLQLAQSNFQQQFSLAQGGDQTALSGITQSADAYLNAGKNFYASSGGYSDIYNAVTAALSSLIGGGGSSLAPVSPLFPTSALSATSSLSSAIVPQASVTSAANDNGALFQQQTTQLSQVFTQVGQAQIVALQSGVTDLGKRLDRIAVAVEAKGKAARPLDKRLGANA